jgi:hypothetical protein
MLTEAHTEYNQTHVHAQATFSEWYTGCVQGDVYDLSCVHVCACGNLDKT